MDAKQKELIESLQLEAHPEGGFYREVYRSEALISNEALAMEAEGDRNVCTSIYFLLTSTNFSAFHRIKQDEIWHFYQGAPIELHTISPNGEHQKFELGHNLAKGERPQVVVPAKHWFAARVSAAHSYALVGCTVAPGFDFRDFELAKRNELIQAFPNHSELIAQFTRA